MIYNLIASLLILVILAFSLYIQFFGKVSPGGGFQAGALIATAYAIYRFATTQDALKYSPRILLKIGATGVLLYLLTGILPLFYGHKFLDYNGLPLITPQTAGIVLVELGIGITVASVLVQMIRLFNKST
jgi:multicomponent Na+:H+ antiporter subunit B